MGLLEKSRWQEWARSWEFSHHPQRGGFIRNEWLVGAHRGYLMKIGWSGDYGSELYVFIRFPRQSEASRLQEQLLNDPELRNLPGWKTKRTKNFLVSESNLLWKRATLWKRPPTATLQGWVEQLLQALAKVVPKFDGRCEECSGSGVSQHVLIEEVPVYLCAGCQERLVAEGTMAQRRYEQQEAHYGLGTLYGAVAAAFGGGCWALLAIVTKHVYAAVAIGIAWLVAHAYYRGAKKIDRVGQLIGAALTIAGVVFGDVVFYAYLVHKDQPEVPFRLDVGWAVFLEVLKQQPGEVIFSLVFGLIGVWYVLRMLQRPRFKPRLEQPQAQRGS